MSLSYEVTNWENGKTVLKAEHLRKIEKGITDIISENDALYTDEDTRKSNEKQRQEEHSRKMNEASEVVSNIQKDYDSLQKIIIDENASANLQKQINSVNSQLEHSKNNITSIQNNKYRTTLRKNQLAVNIQNPLSLTTLKSKFSKFKEIGVNTIVLCPQANLQTSTSNELLEYSRFTFSDVETYTQECINNGFDVIYKLHIECDDGTWRAEITPTDYDTFFNNYKEFILKYGKLAQKYNLKVFCVGEEMMSISTTSFRTYWEDIFNSLKQVYKGKTTYGANLIVWDDEHRRNCIYDFVDYLGIDLWAKQCEVDGDRISSYIHLNGWLIPTFEELYAKYGKKIIFTEIGYLPTPEGGAIPNGTLNQSWDKLDYSYHAQYYDMMFANFIGQEWLESIWYWCENERSYHAPDGAFDRYSIVIDDNIKTQNIFKKYKEV